MYTTLFSVTLEKLRQGIFFLSYLPSKFMCIPMNFFRIKIIFLFEILDLCPASAVSSYMTQEIDKMCNL